ncbi:DUF6476 family protein [Taklimakanibacter albus]|uniref:Uncharacterized protein n=1 Tax=Taklimakanibacter albus TaxID=2800327 RepID=A0ACC5R4Z9_9HYPH|nr:DUF6476 family protein [Aestuariivirga sp. YIM B02566]MBK1867734.1 hypothetical protein [Aestuariivirga sp. YIM B02566]
MTDNQQPDMGDTPPQPGLRFLEWTVYIMGGLLVIMLVVLLGGIAWKATRGKAPEEPPKASLVEIGVPAGATIGSVTLDGNTMAVQVTASGTQEVVVVDTKKGVVVSRVRLKPEGQ